MYELKKKIGTLFTSKSVGTGPSSYEKRIYRAAVPQRLRNSALCTFLSSIYIHLCDIHAREPILFNPVCLTLFNPVCLTLFNPVFLRKNYKFQSHDRSNF